MTHSPMQEKTNNPKKITYKTLADYLGVSESAVKQYNPVKRELMILGLSVKKNQCYSPMNNDTIKDNIK